MARECWAPKYMDGFHCIGTACEDDCCHGWRIIVDQETYKRLKKRMSHNSEDRIKFRNGFKRERGANRSFSNYAIISHNKKKACPFLQENKLCEIHGSFGEEYLSLTCATYPRIIKRVGERWELSAALSCPEVARKCLLGETATEVVKLDLRGLKGKRLAAKGLVAVDHKTYHRHRDVLREVVLNMLSARHYPLSSRLFFAAFFAKKTADFLNEQSRGDVSADLAATIDLFADAVQVEEMHRQFQGMDPPVELPISIINWILLGKSQTSNESFRLLLSEIGVTYGRAMGLGPSADSAAGSDIANMDKAKLLSAYLQRRSGLMGRYASCLDLIFENYCRTVWFASGPEESADLLEHLRKLLVRFVVFRFLLISHPALDPLLDPLSLEENIGSTPKALEQAAVDVAYRFSRGLEHDAKFLEEIQKRLDEQGMKSVAHLALLIKV